MNSYRPGGKLDSRPLHFIWVCDCSGSMSVLGKIQSLNAAIRESIPHMRIVAKDNPFANIQLRALKFSHSATWHMGVPTSLQDFQWMDLEADPLSKPETEIIFLLDTSGSMNNEIKAVKESCLSFAKQISDSGVEVKLGLVGFGIGGFRGIRNEDFAVHELSTYTMGTWPLETPGKFHSKIQALKLRMFGGTGCYLANTDTIEIFSRIVQLYSEQENENTNRVLVIISDEIGDESGLSEITGLLNQNNVKTYVLGVHNDVVNNPHVKLAALTGGKFWDIKKSKGKQDFLKTIDLVANQIASEALKMCEDGTLSKGTDMGKAMEILSEILKIPPMPERALPPVLILVSDGKPTDDFSSGLENLLSQPWGRKSIRLAIAIGKDADCLTLSRFIGNSEIPVMRANNPDALIHHIRFGSTYALNAASNSLPTGRNINESDDAFTDKENNLIVSRIKKEDGGDENLSKSNQIVW